VFVTIQISSPVLEAKPFLGGRAAGEIKEEHLNRCMYEKSQGGEDGLGPAPTKSNWIPAVLVQCSWSLL